MFEPSTRPALIAATLAAILAAPVLAADETWDGFLCCNLGNVDFAKRIVVKDDPRLNIAKFPPRVQQAIAAAHVAPGMTKEQVIMSIGYPITSRESDARHTGVAVLADQLRRVPGELGQGCRPVGNRIADGPVAGVRREVMFDVP